MAPESVTIEIRYDADCGFCTRMAQRCARIFDASIEPLSAEEIAQLESFRVRFYHRGSADERAFGDACLQLICAKRPSFAPIARLGPVRWVADQSYRLVARSRRCTSTCRRSHP